MKKVLLLGMGKSNKSAYKVLKQNGYLVDCLVDDKYKEDGYEYIDIKNINLKEYVYIVRSPGINVFHPFYKLVERMENVINEVELAYILSSKKGYYIGVTGSNGKTTSVKLLYEILSKKYKNVILAGNIGIPLCEYIEKINEDSIIILEMSSYQLENLKTIKFNISCLLSLCPNHLDSVYSLSFYYKSKFNITRNQNENDYFIFPFEYQKYLENGDVRCINLDELNYIFETSLLGDFNNKNINAMYKISKLLDVDDYTIKTVIRDFKPLKYRIEFVTKLNNTIFINDSKSTTVDSTVACYSSFKGKRLLICGGKDKNIDFSILNNINDICVYGEIKDKIIGYKANRLIDLYDYIKNNYKKYEYIIFSPATSSFDQYASYVERAEEFNSMIMRLVDEENKT